MKQILPLILLAACTPLQEVRNNEVQSASSASSAVSWFDSTHHDKEIEDLEQLPAQRTIDYFSKMKLEGKDLKIVATLANTNTYTRYQISYISNGLSISGILNVPKGTGPFPLVVLNHGHIAPSIYTVGRGLKREQDYLARNDFAVLHTDYRGHGLSDESPDTREIYDAGLEYAMDSINAINAVRASSLPELASVDSDRVGMMGHSLGGGVTLNVLTGHPGMIDAAVLYAPVSGDAYKNFNKWRRERPEGDKTLATFGERPEGDAHWDALSAIAHLDRVDDPVLIVHGTDDESCPIAWTYELRDRMEEEGKELTLVTLENEKHEFIPQWDTFMRETVGFYNAHLKAQETAVE